nr:MAG TPA: terminase large subunit [Caudoviricetes sp.]
MEMSIQVSNRFSSFLTDWEYEQYLLLGGYGSGKSYHVALKVIIKLMEEKRTCLVVRQVRETIKESCFALFKEILSKLGILSDEPIRHGQIPKGSGVVATSSPMEFRFPNGSRIIFRGMDNTEKIKSIHGVSIVWMEECSEIQYKAYTELLGRIREPKVTLHFIMTTNPVGKDNWIYNTFFTHTDDKGKQHVIQEEHELYIRRTLVNRKNGVYYHHSLPDDNPFLPPTYINRLDGLKQTDKYLWIVARWGRFGASGVRVLPNFVVAKDAKQFKNKVHSISSRFHFFGLDFGFEESYNALLCCCVDDKEKVLYIYKEIYMNHITDDRFSQRKDVKQVAELAGKCNKPICADSAEPKTIQYYRQQGYNMYGAKKYIGSRLQNTKKMKRFTKIICSPMCKNTIRELKDLTYKTDSKGNVIYDEFNIDPHTFSALWYALDTYTVADLKDIKTNSKAG